MHVSDDVFGGTSRAVCTEAGMQKLGLNEELWLPISLNIIPSHLAFICRASGKKVVLVVSDSKSKDERKF